MSLLEKAIQLALSVHTGQRDKGGAPCILHPLRVMNEMRSESEMIVAVLHDVIEDTSITYVDLQSEGFKQDIIDAVAALTRQKGENYMDFIERCKSNELARKVKIQDINDNMDLSRINNPSKKDYDRQKKYARALRLLLA